MQAQEFYDGVQRRAGLDAVADAERATEAVLATLGERTTAGAGGNVAEALPDEVGEPLGEETTGPADDYDLEEFLARIADREDVSLDAARRDARAVLAGVADAAPADELADLTDQLPDEFVRVLEPGERLTDADFAASVAEASADLDEEEARDAATATLRTFGERLSEGEAADLATYLPPSFADPLVAAAPKTPPAFSVDEFVERIAEQEGIDEETAERHASAVLGVVAEAAGESELRAAQSQLPDEYLELFDRPDRRE